MVMGRKNGQTIPDMKANTKTVKKTEKVFFTFQKDQLITENF